MDADLRAAERSGDRARIIVARLRAGTLTEERFRLAVMCRDPGALAARGHRQRCECLGVGHIEGGVRSWGVGCGAPPLIQWLHRLPEFALLRAGLAAARTVPDRHPTVDECLDFIDHWDGVHYVPVALKFKRPMAAAPAYDWWMQLIVVCNPHMRLPTRRLFLRYAVESACRIVGMTRVRAAILRDLAAWALK